ncbi:MAG: hypothetical protein QF449_07290 [Alphaproteobacteria bacterium]|nr:hypothetical protein [Alphaproteobacteria bacterium]MDP6588478.1 hypothetical protein [Alphaproteobacteria bacterium]MDP6817831.1 hypothetical protein [Alphaproteobacteria bacterium]
MPFIKRDENGEITAIYDRRVQQVGEELPPDHPEITQFLERMGRTTAMREGLDRSDPAMGRVLEDLIECLIEKRLILITDLPSEALNKISQRRNFREDMQAVTGLLSDDTDKII